MTQPLQLSLPNLDIGFVNCEFGLDPEEAEEPLLDDEIQCIHDALLQDTESGESKNEVQDMYSEDSDCYNSTDSESDDQFYSEGIQGIRKSRRKKKKKKKKKSKSFTNNKCNRYYNNKTDLQCPWNMIPIEKKPNSFEHILLCCLVLIALILFCTVIR